MVKITIPNWRERLPRADYKSMPWIKVQSRTYRVREMYGARTSTRWTYIALLCIVAEEAATDGYLSASIEWWEANTNSENIVDDLTFLSNVGLILLENLDVTYVSRTSHVRCTCAIRTDPYGIRTEPNGNHPLEKEKEKEKEKEEEKERKEESLRETTFDAARGGSLSLVNSGTKKRKPKAVQVIDLSDAELDLGTQWLKLAVTHFPNRATDPKWTPHLFALELRKVANVCSYTIADMQKILAHIKHDTFWANKAACPSGLLKKGGNGLRKIENIFAQTKSKAQIKDAQTAQEWAENPEKAAEWQEMLEWIGGKKP